MEGTKAATLTDAERASIYVSELVAGLDKRTKNYRRAREAQALILEIERSKKEGKGRQ